MNNPEIDRLRAIEAIRFLNRPMLMVQVRKLREAYKDFQVKADAPSLLAAIEDLHQQMGEVQSDEDDADSKSQTVLKREDLLLICFDFITGG
jgi:hypothetical protein